MATSHPTQSTNPTLPTMTNNSINTHINHHQPPPSHSNNQINPNIPTKPSLNPYKFVHNFKYQYDSSYNQINQIQELANEYEKAIQITPAQFELKDNGKTIIVTLLTNKDFVHDASNLSTLANLGIFLKLNSNQIDKNSIFCVNGPSSLHKERKADIITELNIYNPDIHVLDCYVLPPKSNSQKTASLKITVATQIMTNTLMNKGIQFENKYINPTLLTRSKILNTSQCPKCQQYNHTYNSCKHTNHICAHCAGNHEIKNCQNKNNIAKCNNCGGSHRTTSNICPIRKKFLIIPSKTEDLNNANALRINPECSYYNEAPIPSNNPWFNSTPQNSTSTHPPPPPNNNINNFPNLPSSSNTPLFPTPTNFPTPNNSTNHSVHNYPTNPNLNNSQPSITYDQCFNMAIKFTDWPFAFKELQKAFHLNPVIEIPSSLYGQLKPEYSTINPTFPPNNTTVIPNPPSTSNNQTTQSHSSPSIPEQNSLIPSPLTSQIHNSKNNFQNNKSNNNSNTGTIPKSTPINQNNPQTVTTPDPPSPIPSSPEADEPAPLSRSSSIVSETSNDSIDVLNLSDQENTIINNPNYTSTPSKSSLSTQNNSSTSHPKKKLINKVITPHEIGNLGPLSPTEKTIIHNLRTRKPNQERPNNSSYV